MMERGHCTGDRVASPYLWLLCNSGMLLISLHFKLLIYLWLNAHWLQPPPALQAFRKQREGFEELAILLARTDLHTRTHSWTGSSNTSSATGQHGSVSLSGGGQSQESKSATELFQVSRKVVLRNSALGTNLNLELLIQRSKIISPPLNN